MAVWLGVTEALWVFVKKIPLANFAHDFASSYSITLCFPFRKCNNNKWLCFKWESKIIVESPTFASKKAGEKAFSPFATNFDRVICSVNNYNKEGS